MIRSSFYYNTSEMSTATTTVVIGPVDCRGFERLCLTFQNDATATQLISCRVEAAHDVSGTAANAAPNWFLINTATLPAPSALGPTAVFMTSAVDNVYSYIRVLAGASATGITTNKFRVTVTGRDKR